MGVDAKSFENWHKYMAIVSDLERTTVEHVAEDRLTESLNNFRHGLSQKQLAGREAVAMDMRTPYIQTTVKCVPGPGPKSYLTSSALGRPDSPGADSLCKVANMMGDHLDNILTYCRHRVTNAVAGGLNSKIMASKRRACGNRNKKHFTTANYFPVVG